MSEENALLLAQVKGQNEYIQSLLKDLVEDQNKYTRLQKVNDTLCEQVDKLTNTLNEACDLVQVANESQEEVVPASKLTPQIVAHWLSTRSMLEVFEASNLFTQVSGIQVHFRKDEPELSDEQFTDKLAETMLSKLGLGIDKVVKEQLAKANTNKAGKAKEA